MKDLAELGQRREQVLAAIGWTEADLEGDDRLRQRVDFFLSSVYEGSRYRSLDDIRSWVADLRENDPGHVELIPVAQLEKWYVEEGTGNIRHDSGKFFSIEGVSIETGGREVASWTQPIINQPEVGILGIIVKRVDGIYYFLMQAKIEPGNIGGWQLSPTVQATHSNYTKVHGGTLPPFVEIFLDRNDDDRYTIVAEELQSEEGARFWKKNNLNILLEVPGEDLEDLPPEFCWMTLHQLKALLLEPNMVNICARSVLSCLP